MTNLIEKKVPDTRGNNECIEDSGKYPGKKTFRTLAGTMSLWRNLRNIYSAAVLSV